MNYEFYKLWIIFSRYPVTLPFRPYCTASSFHRLYMNTYMSAFTLHDNSLVHDIGIILKPDGDYHFKAKLYPLFNDNTSGQYRVYKEVEFNGINKKWYMAAEFKIE